MSQFSAQTPPTPFDPVLRSEKKKKEKKERKPIPGGEVRYSVEKHMLKKSLERYGDINQETRSELIEEMGFLPNFISMNSAILSAALALFIFMKTEKDIPIKLFNAQIQKVMDPWLTDPDHQTPEMIERLKIDILRYAKYILEFRQNRFADILNR